MPKRTALVMGGGVAGLVAARELARDGISVTLVEKSPRLGGVVRRTAIAGVSVDGGAESFATRGGAVATLINELGLGDDIIQPNPQGAFLYTKQSKRSVPMPKNLVHGIPVTPLAKDVVDAIGWPGALRAYADRLCPLWSTKHQTLAGFVKTRMGRTVVDSLVSAVTTGIYSIDAEDIDVQALIPGIDRAARGAGSLSGGVHRLRVGAGSVIPGSKQSKADQAPRPGTAVLGLRGGIATLVDALTVDLERLGVKVYTGIAEPKVLRVDGKWRVSGIGHAETFDALVMAAPEREAQKLLSASIGHQPWNVLDQQSYVQVAILAVDHQALDDHPVGTGVLVGRGTDVQAKALTHATAKWSWLKNEIDVPHRHVLRLSYAAADATASTTEEQWLEDARKLTGVDIRAEHLVDSTSNTWLSSTPLNKVGSRAELDDAISVLGTLPSFAVVGSWVAGTGLASVVPHARKAAAALADTM